jgi:hypothetical protein
MINACELCAKITLENALREEAERIAEAKRAEELRIQKTVTAKAFAEEIIAPMLENLTEIPDHLFLGYRPARSEYSGGLFTRIGEWENELTARKNPVKRRYLENEVKGQSSYSRLDFEFLNQYLANFGFQVSAEYKKMIQSIYSTSTKDGYVGIYEIYLTLTCPLEE